MSKEKKHRADCQSDGLDWWCGSKCPVLKALLKQKAEREADKLVDAVRMANGLTDE